jgi:hypothetical protein
MCTDPQVINPPSDTTCAVGGILTVLGIILIAGVIGGAVGALSLAAGFSVAFVLGLFLHTVAIQLGALDEITGFEITLNESP